MKEWKKKRADFEKKRGQYQMRNRARHKTKFCVSLDTPSFLTLSRIAHERRVSRSKMMNFLVLQGLSWYFPGAK